MAKVNNSKYPANLPLVKVTIATTTTEVKITVEVEVKVVGTEVMFTKVIMVTRVGMAGSGHEVATSDRNSPGGGRIAVLTASLPVPLPWTGPQLATTAVPLVDQLIALGQGRG